MKITLLETFDRTWRLKTEVAKEAIEFKTSNDLSIFLKDNNLKTDDIVIHFLRKPVPKEAVISYIPATDWYDGHGRWGNRRWEK